MFQYSPCLFLYGVSALRVPDMFFQFADLSDMFPGQRMCLYGFYFYHAFSVVW